MENPLPIAAGRSGNPNSKKGKARSQRTVCLRGLVPRLKQQRTPNRTLALCRWVFGGRSLVTLAAAMSLFLVTNITLAETNTFLFQTITLPVKGSPSLFVDIDNDGRSDLLAIDPM